MAVILSHSNAWADGSGRRPEVLRRWSEITSARLSRPGIFTQFAPLNPVRKHKYVWENQSVMQGYDECFQPWVMLWDCTWEGLGWIKPPRQKTAEPETSRFLVSSQIHIHTWTDGNTRSLGRWRKTWWNMPGGLRMCIHRTTHWIHNKSHCFHVLSPCEGVTLGKRVISSQNKLLRWEEPICFL